MLIVHVIVDLLPGGAELALLRLVTADGAGGDIRHHVISLRSVGPVGERLRAAGIAVEALDITSIGRSLPGLLRLRRRIAALDPAVVQTWMYHADLIGGLATRLTRRRGLIWGVRTADVALAVGTARPTRWVRRVCALVSRWLPDRIVYVAESARAVHEALGYARSKGVVVPNGYAVPPPDPDAAAALRRELALADDPILIGSAGRYNALKDHYGFVAACAQVATAEPRARFVLIGRGVDDANSELTAAIAATGHADRFHLLGERRDLDRVLAGLDIFCLHSIVEGFPNVVAEAMAAGVVCVVTDVGDAAALVADPVRTVPPARPDLLAAALLRLTRADRAVRADLGAAGRAVIQDHYSMPAVVERYHALYRTVTDNAAIVARKDG